MCSSDLKYENKTFVIGDYVLANAPIYSKGCRSSRDLIKKKNIEDKKIIYARLKDNEWNCGDNIWVMQILAKSHAKEIMKWVKDYFRDKIEVNESVKWIRADENFNIYRRSEKFKREFHI